MVRVSYIISFALLFALTLANMSTFIVTKMFAFIGIPQGYMNFTLMVLALPFLCIIVFKRKESIVKPFMSLAKFWLPWIVYLCISGSLTIDGTWKLKMYLGLLVLPSMLFVVMALANPALFEKYFMKVLLCVNLFLLIIYSFDLVQVRSVPGAEGVQRLIWLSRGLGINIAYFLITSAWKKRPVIMVPFIVMLFGAMIYIGSRGPVISLIVTMGVFWLIKNRKNLATTILGSAALGLIIISFMNVGYLSNFVTSFSTHGERREFSEVGRDRLSAYGPSLTIFADRPITGVGLGQWWSVYKKKYAIPYWQRDDSYQKKLRGERDYLYPHNIFLEVLSELGLIGMGLFLLLFVPFKRLFMLSNRYNILLLLGILYACFSSDITQNSAPVIFNFLSILYAKGFLQKRENNRGGISSLSILPQNKI